MLVIKVGIYTKSCLNSKQGDPGHRLILSRQSGLGLLCLTRHWYPNFRKLSANVLKFRTPVPDLIT